MLRAHSPLGIPFALSLVFPHSLNGNLAWWVANACESHHILEFGTYIELALCFSLLPAHSSHNEQANDHESVKFFFSRHSSPALYHSHSFILSFKYGVLFSLNIASLNIAFPSSIPFPLNITSLNIAFSLNAPFPQSIAFPLNISINQCYSQSTTIQSWQARQHYSSCCHWPVSHVSSIQALNATQQLPGLATRISISPSAGLYQSLQSIQAK